MSKNPILHPLLLINILKLKDIEQVNTCNIGSNITGIVGANRLYNFQQKLFLRITVLSYFT